MANWDQFIRLWDLEDGVVLRDLTRPADVRYGTLSFSPDGRVLVASTLELIGGILVVGYLGYMSLNPPGTPPPAIEFTSVEVGDIVTVAVTAPFSRWL